MLGENLRSITKIDNDIVLIKTSNNTYIYKAVGEWGNEAGLQRLNC